MILIEKADRHRRCNCCNSNKDVYEILFRMDNHGTGVAICSDCIEELRMKIPGREVKANE